jgi:hypothetical protein
MPMESLKELPMPVFSSFLHLMIRSIMCFKPQLQPTEPSQFFSTSSKTKATQLCSQSQISPSSQITSQQLFPSKELLPRISPWILPSQGTSKTLVSHPPWSTKMASQSKMPQSSSKTQRHTSISPPITTTQLRALIRNSNSINLFIIRGSFAFNFTCYKDLNTTITYEIDVPTYVN